MSKVRVAAFAVSLDGFSAGPNQSLENPLGVGFPEVMGWFFPTRCCLIQMPMGTTPLMVHRLKASF